MWREQTKHVPFSAFMPNNEIKTYFKNDQLVVLLLSMTMYDMTIMIDGNKSLHKTTHKWIRKNIDLETVRLTGFVRSLTVATAIVCSNDDSNVDFFNRDRGMLIANHVPSECEFSTTEIPGRGNWNASATVGRYPLHFGTIEYPTEAKSALMRTFHFPTMSTASLCSLLNRRFGADSKASSYSRLSTGTGHFRITVWDPTLIVAQITSVQCLYYFTMCFWITVVGFVVGTSRSLDVIFQFKELNAVASEKFVVVVFALNALSGATFIWRVVERYRLCLDFSCTIHIIHLAACVWYNGSLPTSFWWLLNIACAAITCICAEFLCMRTELNAIPVNSGQAPKVNL